MSCMKMQFALVLFICIDRFLLNFVVRSWWHRITERKKIISTIWDTLNRSTRWVLFASFIFNELIQISWKSINAPLSNRNLTFGKRYSTCQYQKNDNCWNNRNFSKVVLFGFLFFFSCCPYMKDSCTCTKLGNFEMSKVWNALAVDVIFEQCCFEQIVQRKANK